MLLRPETRFVRVEGEDVAYQTLGSGDVDLLIMAGSATNVDVWWDYPEAAQLWADLAQTVRVVLFDRRGAGVSERRSANDLPRWSEWALEAEAVLKAVGSRRVVVMGVLDGGGPTLALAHRRPDLIERLVLVRTAARIMTGDGYDIGLTPAEFDEWCERWRSGWGTEDWVQTMYPSAVDPRFVQWSLRYQRACYNSRVGVEFMRQWADVDVRDLCPEITQPTLIIGRDEGLVSLQHAHYLSEHIPGARLVTIAGEGGLLEVVTELRQPLLEFIGSDVGSQQAAVLFTDIVNSTVEAISQSESQWAEALDAHDLTVRKVVAHARGAVVKFTGDGVVAAFVDVAAAVAAAQALVTQVPETTGLRIRAGVHYGTVIARGNDIGGPTVHAAARIMAHANAGEVLVSDDVAEAVGTSFVFGPPDLHQLRGFDEPMSLRRIAGAGDELIAPDLTSSQSADPD